MKFTALALGACAALLCAGRSLHAETELWADDFKRAQEKAAKEGKDLLLDFTGSDWCGWCVRLKKEVFDTEEFKQEAPKHFVLVELDYPHEKALAEAIKIQNQALQKAFGIGGYPSIVLADARGRAYARTGYQEGGPAAYLPHLAELRKQKSVRDEAFGKAEKATGLDKAKLLDQVLTQVESQAPLTGYQDVMQEIIRLDATNQGGLKKKYEERQRVIVTRAKFDEVEAVLESGDQDAALQMVEAFLKAQKPEGEFKQKALFLKALLLHAKKNKAGCIESLKAAREADPESPIAKQIPAILQKIEAEGAAKEAPPK